MTNLYEELFEEISKSPRFKKIDINDVRDLTGDLPLLMTALKGKCFELLDREAVKQEKAGNRLQAQEIIKIKEEMRSIFKSFWRAIEIRQERGVKSILLKIK